MRKSGACETTRLKVAECVTPPPLPVAVNVNVPGDTEEVVVMLNAELKLGVPDVGLNAPETPAGAPDKLRATLCGAPETNFTLTV